MAQEGDELLPPVAVEHVAFAQGAGHRPGEGPKDLVASGVAVGVVDLLEVVDVQHHQTQRVAVPA